MRRLNGAGVFDMTERDSENVVKATERVERRLAEETGQLRVEMARGFGTLETKMADRNAELLKWLLVYGCLQTGALGGLIVFV